MMALSLSAMRGYLSKSLSSINDNKMRGLLAEIEFRKHLATLGFAHRVPSTDLLKLPRGHLLVAGKA